MQRARKRIVVLILSVSNRNKRISAVATIICLVSIFIVMFSSASLTAPDGDYLQYVSEALVSLEVGQTRESLESLKKALEFNENDTLAHVALGMTLLSGGRIDDAMAEFDRALEIDNKCGEAQYGRGLVSLHRGHFDIARAQFEKAKSVGTGLDAHAPLQYIEHLTGRANAQSLNADTDPVLRTIHAVYLMNQARYKEAMEIWRVLQNELERPSFGEPIGCSMSLLRSAPITLAGWPINEPYRPPSQNYGNLPVVSGRVLLKADLSKAADVTLVSFFIDNKLAGITNTPPFSYGWETTRVANGPHTIEIQGSNSDGDILTEKSQKVVVRNANPVSTGGSDSDPRATKAWDKLKKIMRLKPSASAVNYSLALCSLKLGDTNSAIASLERVMAARPDYADSADRLAELYKEKGRHEYSRLYKVHTEKKLVALTFDDGPKADTDKLLKTLSDKDVKATFFIVGKQAEQYPETIMRLVDEGHDIQNHTYSHRNFEYISEYEIQQEIFKTAAIVRSLTGQDVTMLRPPGGHEGKKLPGIMEKFGMKTIFWTANCSKTEGTKQEKILDHVMELTEPGAIVLMHNTELVTLNALPDLIDNLRQKGYSFVTLSELVGEQ